MVTWFHKAALYELLAQSFLYTSEELANAVTNGEYAKALAEIAILNGINEEVAESSAANLSCYQSSRPSLVFHALRREYTRLFIGSEAPLISPFGSMWKPGNTLSLLFINKEAMAVKDAMSACGFGRLKGTNEPLDHIGTELEFLEYLCLLKTRAVEVPKGVLLPDDAFEAFYERHYADWAGVFAAKVRELSREPFFTEAATLLQFELGS